jgi:hypothetical protein
MPQPFALFKITSDGGFPAMRCAAGGWLLSWELGAMVYAIGLGVEVHELKVMGCYTLVMDDNGVTESGLARNSKQAPNA